MTAGRLIIRTPGGLTTIQDAGRAGAAFYAFPRCGAMDQQSAGLANVLVRNEKSSPVIECTLVAPRIEFETKAHMAITGTDFSWRLDGRRIERDRVIKVAEGGILEGAKATDGLRGYIAIAGQFKVDHNLGSSSSHPATGLGANSGNPLSAGCILEWQQPASEPPSIELLISPRKREQGAIKLVAGPEYDWLNETSKKQLVTSSFRVTPTSNRMGARLEGPALSVEGKTLTASVPVLPGMIQLTPSGQAIVVLQDGQTTGGYPRIAYIPSKELARFNQIMINNDFHFKMSDVRCR